jgi:hypothetical protein
MHMFDWFRSKDVENFATELVDEFARRSPPESLKSGVQPAKVLASSIDELCNRAGEFQKGRKLGVYGKAKFGTTVKYRMKDLGYADEFIDELTRSLLIRISGR